MTQDEFIKKAKSLNYDDEQIKEILDLRDEEKRKYGVTMSFDEIILVEQAVY